MISFIIDLSLRPSQPINKCFNHRRGIRLFSGRICDSQFDEPLPVGEHVYFGSHGLALTRKRIGECELRVLTTAPLPAWRHLNGPLRNHLSIPMSPQHISFARLEMPVQRVVGRSLGNWIDEDSRGDFMNEVVVSSSYVLSIAVILDNLNPLKVMNAWRKPEMRSFVGVCIRWPHFDG